MSDLHVDVCPKRLRCQVRCPVCPPLFSKTCKTAGEFAGYGTRFHLRGSARRSSGWSASPAARLKNYEESVHKYAENAEYAYVYVLIIFAYILVCTPQSAHASWSLSSQWGTPVAVCPTGTPGPALSASYSLRLPPGLPGTQKLALCVATAQAVAFFEEIM